MEDVEIIVNKYFIAKATYFPTEGMRLSKDYLTKNIPWEKFLISKKNSYNVKGMIINLLKRKWKDLVLIIKRYITCEGHYGFIFYYHFQFVMFFLGYKLNIPYYLFKSLTKMLKFHQKGFNKPDRSLFHYGLIQILVEFRLSQIRDSWEAFLGRNNFVKPQLVNDEEKLPPKIE